MPRFLSLTSPYPTVACAQRLQQLAAHTTYRVSVGGQTVDLSRLRLDIVRDAEDGFAFALRVRSRDRSRRSTLGGIVFLTVGGHLVPDENGADVIYRIRPGLPVTFGEWLLQLLWYGALLAIEAGLLLAAWIQPDPRLWQAAGGVALLVAALYLLLIVVNVRSTRAMEALLSRAVAAPPPGKPARITVLR